MRWPLGGRRRSLAAAIWLAAATVLNAQGAGSEDRAAPGQLIQVMVTPEGRLYAPKPVRVSLKGQNRVRWVCKDGVLVVFPLEGFPTLSDGSRLRILPFTKMTYREKPKARWIPDCQETLCESGSLNPELAEALRNATGGHLEWVYQLKRSGQVVEARLVVEP